MTIDEFKTSFADIMSDPAKNAAAAAELLKGVEADYVAAAALKADHDKTVERVKDLETTNQKLFLSLTQKPEEGGESEDTEDLTGQEAVDAFWSALEKKEEK